MGKPKILIVEDQVLISTNIKLLLKFNNYDVFGVAQNAEDALFMIEQSQPDLVLMDIALPGAMDGIDAAKIIMEKWNLPVIYLTAKKDSETVNRAKQSTPYGFLTKDIELKEQLPIVVEFAIYKHQMELEREIALKKISESEEKFRSIASSAKDAIIFMDNDGKITFWNESATRIFGYYENEVIGQYLSDLIAPNAYKDFYYQGFTDFKELGKGNFIDKTIELEALNKNGKMLPVEASVSSMKLKGDWCAFGIFRDISVRKGTEQEIERLIEELQISRDLIEKNANELIILNSKLRDSEQKLKELNASKDRFFSIIAHDLKNPFQSLMGFSEILSKDVDQLSKKEIKEFATDLNESAKQLFKLLENLLQWTRLQRGKMECEMQELHIKKLADLNIDLLSLQASQKKIKIDNMVNDDLLVLADMNMINTIIRNLLSNALKFTNNGGKISINSLKLDNGNAEISISDNGIGMDEESMDKLFKIDVHHTSLGTNKEKGTGLGLILCKEMIEKNNGSIRIESKLNEGTTFIITLPIA